MPTYFNKFHISAKKYFFCELTFHFEESAYKNKKKNETKTEASEH
jgi:hypothetical protein